MTLRFGPLDGDALVICIDMQRMFLEPGVWFGPEGLSILPACGALCDAAPDRALFTRFVPARNPEAAQGAWRGYYERWRDVTLEAAGEGPVALHADLAPHAAPDRVFDKPTHNAFEASSFRAFIAARQPSALVLCGVETDVCVLATALTAVDLGIRTIIAEDAVASSDHAGHRAAIDAIYPRFDMQIELCRSAEITAGLRAS